jgi:hypothetical protein
LNFEAQNSESSDESKIQQSKSHAKCSIGIICWSVRYVEAAVNVEHEAEKNGNWHKEKISVVVMHNICASHWYQVSSIHHAFRHETKIDPCSFFGEGVCV